MIRSIVEQIGKGLNEEFGEGYQIYSENMPQDFKTPCFIINCVNYSRGKALSNRFLVNLLFEVIFFPDEESLEQNDEIWDSADRMFDVLERVGRFSGDNLKANFSEGVLMVNVNYSFQAIKESTKNNMDNLLQKGVTK